MGTIEKVKFLWNNNVVNPSFPKVGAAKITVQKGEERTEYVPSFAGLSHDVCRGCRESLPPPQDRQGEIAEGTVSAKSLSASLSPCCRPQGPSAEKRRDLRRATKSPQVQQKLPVRMGGRSQLLVLFGIGGSLAWVPQL